MEKAWLDRFLAMVTPGGTVLDVGCGMGEPIASYILQRGFRVVGVDSAPSLIGLARQRLPQGEWRVADMRALALGRQFEGVLAWDSFFHLGMDEQRAMFPRFAAHAGPEAPLMLTAGPAEGEAIGSYHGEPLYHSSLDPAEYQQLLAEHGFARRAYVAEDPTCGKHTVWLAQLQGD
jgi:trans-aconitate methyltransferase